MRQTVKAGLLGGMVMLSGCAFTDGAPWGEGVFLLEPTYKTDATRKLSPNTIRATAEGKNYIVEPSEVRLEVSSVELIMAPEGSEGGSAKFDPAKPPEGYTLCHNGHCHRKDGALVPYDKVKVEIGDNGAEGERVTIKQKVAFKFAGLTSITSSVSLPVVMLKCPQDGNKREEVCDLPKGKPQEVIVRLSKITLKGKQKADGDTGVLHDFNISQAVDLELSAIVHDEFPTEEKDKDISKIGMKLGVDAGIFSASNQAFDALTGTGKDLGVKVLNYIYLRLATKEK